ncbi:MAG TPA: NAD-dependent epimerase/dehydratase family protein [Bryobacteraceae bacterium]|jgi:UDP-glucose 4-epimerase|nr:NAD-dependent epimerase/dehydratase family protein [Bryobacteraceae bacterium]
MKPILIWGATGFMGQSLVAGFLAEGWPVTILTRRDPGTLPFAKNPNLRVVSLPEDPATWDFLPNVIVESDVIYSLAGVSGAVASNLRPIDSLDGNCRIHAAFLSYCAKAANRPHVVFPSSRLVYGAPDSLPVAETAAVRPASVYAAHKLCVEHYHQIAASRGEITYTICRISNPYGFYEGPPGQGYGFISDLIQKGLKSQPVTLFGEGEQIRDYIHIDDLFQALKLCGAKNSAHNHIVNVGCGQGISIRQAAGAIKEITGAPIVHVPWPADYLKVESGDYVADIRKARHVIGFEPKFRFEDGLQDLVSKHRQNELGHVARGENFAQAIAPG